MSAHEDRQDALLRLLNIDLPIIQAPMAGICSPALAAAVSNAGGLGSIGVGALDAAVARVLIEELRSRTANPFNVSLVADDEAMLQMLLLMRPAVVSFHRGLPPRTVVEGLQQSGIVLMATATTLREARQIAAAGVDVIVATSLALTRRIVGKLAIPVIASGCITDGAGIAAALRLGAAGVHLGTAFARCAESASPQAGALSAAELMARLADELWVA